MKLIKPNFEIWEPHEGKDGYLKDIERAARICYKSENKITEDSYKKIVDSLIVSGHGAALEHGTVYLMAKTELVNYYIHPEDGKEGEYNPLEKYCQNKYSHTNDNHINLYVTTNLRVLVENNWLDDLKYICEPTKYHEKRVTVKFITDQGILREFTRHRVFSFSVESTRYCNYSLDKFDKNITYIISCWLDVPEEVIGIPDVEHWAFRNNEPFGHIGKIHGNMDFHVDKQVCRFLDVLRECERYYFQLLEIGWKPQQARNVLPLATKTEIVMTGFVSDWKNFFELRCASNAHPQARELAIPLREEFIKRGYINE